MSRSLFRLFFRTVTATFFVAGALVLLGQYRQVQQWPQVTGRVERAEVVISGDPEDSRVPGQRYEPLVSYRYHVDGDPYQAERLAVHRWIYRRRENAREYLATRDIYRGATVPVYYNPGDPAEAVLVADVPWWRGEVLVVLLLMVVLPLVVVAVELVTYISALRSPEG